MRRTDIHQVDAMTPSTADDDKALRHFARAWARSIAGIGFVPLSGPETELRLGVLAERLADALYAEPFSAQPAHRVGESLVEANLTDARALEASLNVVAEELAGLSAEPERVAALLAALAAGYARALRVRTLNEQERLSKSIFDALWASDARFRAVFASAATGIGIADIRGRMVDSNQALGDMLGYTVEEIRRRTVSDLMDPYDTADMDRYLRLVRGEMENIRMDKVLIRKDGGTIRTDMTVSLIRDEAGNPRYTVATISDITERYLLQERLRHQALHDPLTGLANRRLFTERLEAVFEAGDPRARVGVCCLDLDRFKYINDSHGHAVGDLLLATVARRLDAYAATNGHLAARMGGDEFVILVSPSGGIDQLTAVAEALIETMAEPVVIGPHRLHISASVGVVERAVAGTTPSEITKAGDVTLQWAKTAGRGRWALFDAERHDQQLARYRLASTMAAAIENNEFTLLYQPLVRLTDGRTRGVEALVRWQHPRFGLMSPDRFIGLAEETGLIVPLGRWILREACRQAARWRCGDLFVSVNLAVPQLEEPDIVQDVAAALADTGLDPAMLQLELTESAVMTSEGRPLQALRDLAEMGVRIAIDDFGTGYSNLAYLRTLPVHALKLAGTFIAPLRDPYDRQRTDEQLVDNLIRLAHAIGLTVTAEAVETRAQADLLHSFECDLAQGWFLGAPVPAAKITVPRR